MQRNNLVQFIHKMTLIYHSQTKQKKVPQNNNKERERARFTN